MTRNISRILKNTTLRDSQKKIYMPFGEGPRNCIGERFGMLGTKLGLIHILSEFELEKSTNTPVQLTFEPRSFVLASK
ncbi:p450 domain containing protein, partial [Asbolus verrucosus]